MASLDLENLSFRKGGGSSAPSSTLAIKAPTQMGNIGTLKFQNHNLLGKFMITRAKQYSEEEADIAALIAPDKMSQLIGTNLGLGYDSAVKLMDYSSYHSIKQEFFFKWLKNEKYFQKVQTKYHKQPKFVCFGGRITDPMQSPLKSRYGEWTILAAKYMDTIFLWDEKTGTNHNHTKEGFYGVALEALLTGKEPGQVDEHEKMFVVQEAQFGSHQLLVVNEIDAEDQPEEWVEITAFKKCSPKGMEAKYLKMWAQSIIPGVKKVITGERDENGFLRAIEVLSLDEVLTKAKCNFSVNQSYSFQDRLLTWIHSHFTNNDHTLVKQFSWAGAPSSTVQCKTLGSGEYKAFFPKWFLDEH